ncbi:transporter substrate-binding domain-containing protein [Dietzia sp. NCCP-2495]|uniref:transporter substrate-binding domain-containing protein n=1 Tax=Dietzia sp. NCCP-2495 TaxID=2934675 RepID=UPI00222FBECF|nr:transporter substrate-binding domain-containing protein [Dietzia sp. NCCP-2495]
MSFHLTRVRTRTEAVAVLLSLALCATACGGPFPRDTDGSLDRITGGTLRVGVSENVPWTESLDDGSVAGREVDLVTGFAATIDAEPDWTPGAESELIMAMKRGDLDVVIGGLTADSPWSKEVALTRPYATEVTPDGETEKMVMATPLGENALLVALETHLAHTGEAQ